MAKKINIQRDVESRRRISQGLAPTVIKEDKIENNAEKIEEDAQGEADKGTEADESDLPSLLPKKRGRATNRNT